MSDFLSNKVTTYTFGIKLNLSVTVCDILLHHEHKKKHQHHHSLLGPWVKVLSIKLSEGGAVNISATSNAWRRKQQLHKCVLFCNVFCFLMFCNVFFFHCSKHLNKDRVFIPFSTLLSDSLFWDQIMSRFLLCHSENKHTRERWWVCDIFFTGKWIKVQRPEYFSGPEQHFNSTLLSSSISSNLFISSTFYFDVPTVM